MLDTGIWEHSFDLFKVFLTPERQVIDFERVVQLIACSIHLLNDILEPMMRNVKVAWNAHCLHEPLNPAALAINELLMDSVRYIRSFVILFLYGLNGELVAILVEPVLVELAKVVSDVVPQLVLQVETNDIAWHSWQLDIDVDMEFVRVVRRLDCYRTRCHGLNIVGHF